MGTTIVGKRECNDVSKAVKMRRAGDRVRGAAKCNATNCVDVIVIIIVHVIVIIIVDIVIIL